MYQPLAPCTSCRRHLRTTETVCPFCGAALDGAELARGVVPGTKQRLGRAAAFVFGASLAVSQGVACSGDTQNPSGASGAASGGGGEGAGSSSDDDDGSSGVALYGAPAVDGGPDD